MVWFGAHDDRWRLVVDTEMMSGLARKWLEGLGEDPEREGLRETPRRMAEAWSYLTKGYGQDPVALLNGARFRVEANHMVIMRDIEVYSMCEHHLLPFFGCAISDISRAGRWSGCRSWRGWWRCLRGGCRSRSG